MNTLNISHARVSWRIIAALFAAVALIGAIALIARADTAPTVTNSIQSGTNVSLSTAPIGTSVFDVATIASSTSSTTPTGTVDFNVYANTGCSGTPTTQAGVALVNGAATSSNTIVPATGLSYLVNYSGDASTTSTNSSCQALTATAASVSIGTSLSTSTVLAGSSVYDTATLSNETSDATGTVTYTAYTNNLCTTGAQSAGAKTVSSGGVPNSDSIPFNTAGTYYWQAVYSGDQNNSSVTSSCTSEPLVVQATSTPVTPPATGPGTISGTVFNDLNKNNVEDGSDVGLASVTVWLHSGNAKNGYNNPIVQTTTTDGNGNYSFSNLALGNYFVEESVPAGWVQTTPDVKVVLGSGNTGGTANFANVMKNATSTNPGHTKCDGDNDADDVGCTATTTPTHGNGNNFWNGFWNHFNFGFHFGQVQHAGNQNGKDK